MQYKDRDKWYLPKFAADDAPEWNPAQLVEVKQQAPGLREVILKAGGVPGAHPDSQTHISTWGQRAQVRVKSGASAELTGMYFAASASASLCPTNATPRSHRSVEYPTDALPVNPSLCMHTIDRCQHQVDGSCVHSATCTENMPSMPGKVAQTKLVHQHTWRALLAARQGSP